MPTMIDLGCGLGGASRAMRDRGWRVIRVDLMDDVRPDVVADIRALPLKRFPADLLWISTSCSQFTVWRLPWPSAVRARKPIDLSVELGARAFIEWFKPKTWILENVYSSRP